MQDPSSYVYSGRDGSGAATILKPFDSSRIFRDYDNARAPKKNPILDSLGKDILSMGTKISDPQDALVINKETKEFIDLASKLYAENTDLMSNPDAFYQVVEKKKRIADLASKSLRTTQAYKAAEENVRRNPQAYPSDALDVIKQSWNLGPENRPATPPVQRYKPADFEADFRQVGKSLEVTVNRKNADGSYSTYTKYDPSKLPEVWDAVYEAKQTDPKFQSFIAAVTEDVKGLAKSQGIDYDTLPLEEQAKLVYAEGMKQFGATKESQIARRSGSGAAPEDKAETKKGKAQQNAIVQGYVVTARPIKNKDNEFDIKKVQSWVVANKETGNPADNTPMTFEGGVIGSPQRIENIEGKSTPILVVRTGNGTTKDYEMVEIPLTPINASKLKAEYGFDWEKIRKDPKFVKPYQEFDVNTLTVEDFVNVKGEEPAKEIKYKGKTYPIPAGMEKEVLQKALDKRKGVKATAPAKPDAASKYIKKYGR